MKNFINFFRGKRARKDANGCYTDFSFFVRSTGEEKTKVLYEVAKLAREGQDGLSQKLKTLQK